MTPQQAGLLAASKIIEGRLTDALRVKPTRTKSKKKCAQYKIGYYDGVLLAWCILAIAEYPQQNIEQIDKTIGVDWRNA